MSFPSHVPALSTTQAHLLALSIAASYVGSIYASQSTRTTHVPRDVAERGRERARHRDDPSVIRARLTAVVVSTALSCLAILVVVQLQSEWPGSVCSFPLLSNLPLTFRL